MDNRVAGRRMGVGKELYVSDRSVGETIGYENVQGRERVDFIG